MENIHIFFWWHLRIALCQLSKMIPRRLGNITNPARNGRMKRTFTEKDLDSCKLLLSFSFSVSPFFFLWLYLPSNLKSVRFKPFLNFTQNRLLRNSVHSLFFFTFLSMANKNHSIKKQIFLFQIFMLCNDCILLCFIRIEYEANNLRPLACISIFLLKHKQIFYHVIFCPLLLFQIFINVFAFSLSISFHTYLSIDSMKSVLYNRTKSPLDNFFSFLNAYFRSSFCYSSHWGLHMNHGHPIHLYQGFSHNFIYDITLYTNYEVALSLFFHGWKIEVANWMDERIEKRKMKKKETELGVILYK